VHNYKPSPIIPLSNGIKIVSEFQRLHSEIGCTNSEVQKGDGQTDKKTPAPVAGEIRAPPNLAM